MLAFAGCDAMATATQFTSTVTVTVNVFPTQLPEVGVTKYVAVPVPEGIDNVPLMLVWGVVWELPPVTPLVYVGTVHV
jgi:hypothetical protein